MVFLFFKYNKTKSINRKEISKVVLPKHRGVLHGIKFKEKATRRYDY